MIETCLGGQLFLAPLREPRRILDLGTGTGIWALDVGDLHERAEVVGNDLSPIQPAWVPPNVRFEVDDVEAEWTYSQPFDLIHCRQMGATIRDWPHLVGQAFKHTAPGGYAEFCEYDLTYTSPDGSLTEATTLRQTNIQFLDALRKIDVEPNVGPLLEGYLKEAGFEDVVVKKFPLPVGTWPLKENLVRALNCYP